MSEGFALLNSRKPSGIGGKVHGGRESKASFGDTTRKKLADITNMPQQDLSLIQNAKSQVMPISAKEYIEQLQKENLALQSVLADRNKLIELTGVELQKLRLHLQKQQQQNSQLAQSNSQILQELNSGKDRLKILQHELRCKDAMLKVKDLEIKEHLIEKKCEETHCKATQVFSKAGTNDDKIWPNKRTQKSKSINSNGEIQSSDEIENKRPRTRRQSCRFSDQYLKPGEDRLEMAAPETSQCQPNDNDKLPGIHSTSACLSVQKVDDTGIDAPKQALGNKRPFVRRQSSRFQSQESNPSEDFVDIKGGKMSAPACLSLSSRDEDAEVSLDCALSEESRISSVSRPSRQAAKKVQSYKEVPLNIKMRRPV